MSGGQCHRHSSHHPHEVLLAQFSLYVHRGGLKPHSFHFIEYEERKPVKRGALYIRIIFIKARYVRNKHYRLTKKRYIRNKHNIHKGATYQKQALDWQRCAISETSTRFRNKHQILKGAIYQEQALDSQKRDISETSRRLTKAQCIRVDPCTVRVKLFLLVVDPEHR